METGGLRSKADSRSKGESTLDLRNEANNDRVSKGAVTGTERPTETSSRSELHHATSAPNKAAAADAAEQLANRRTASVPQSPARQAAAALLHQAPPLASTYARLGAKRQRHQPLQKAASASATPQKKPRGYAQHAQHAQHASDCEPALSDGCNTVRRHSHAAPAEESTARLEASTFRPEDAILQSESGAEGPHAMHAVHAAPAGPSRSFLTAASNLGSPVKQPTQPMPRAPLIVTPMGRLAGQQKGYATLHAQRAAVAQAPVTADAPSLESKQPEAEREDVLLPCDDNTGRKGGLHTTSFIT